MPLDDFNGYSAEQLVQLFNYLKQTGGLHNGELSLEQKKKLLARFATVRANLDQTIQDLDEAIVTLGAT